jgi:hypothetical protein
MVEIKSITDVSLPPLGLRLRVVLCLLTIALPSSFSSSVPPPRLVLLLSYRHRIICHSPAKIFACNSVVLVVGRPMSRQPVPISDAS